LSDFGKVSLVSGVMGTSLSSAVLITVIP
jgi:hypothetical protein